MLTLASASSQRMDGPTPDPKDRGSKIVLTLTLTLTLTLGPGSPPSRAAECLHGTLAEGFAIRDRMRASLRVGEIGHR